jgi:uncharacterized caspase-like protein
MQLRQAIIAICALIWAACCSATGPRVALIIGNSNYASARLKLNNPVNDATAMQQALRSAGFETILKLNVNRRDFYRAVDEFSARIGRDPHAVGLFYYAGHGVQADGTNYLIPVDAEIDSDADLQPNAYDVSKVLAAMKQAQNDMNIVILDACRDNPLPRTRGVDRGLARMDAPTGTFIAYAAAPGQVAHDGASGTNGVFTGELIKAITLANVPLEQMFKKVIAGVRADTHGAQQPWSEASIQGEFYFHESAVSGAVPGAGGTPPAAAAVHVPTATELDESYWQAIKDSKDQADFASYSKNFPKGMHLAEAGLMARRLSHEATPHAAVSRDTAQPPPAAASRAQLVPGGPYPAWGTSSLFPGVIGSGTIVVNNDGTLEAYNSLGDGGRVTLDLSDPEHVTGTELVHLGGSGANQRHYPDGSTSTQVTIRARLANGVLIGTYSDKFQTGQLNWNVAPGK